MGLDLLQQLFGGNQQRQQEYQDFAQRFQNDPNSISDEEAARRYRELLRNAPPDAVAAMNEEAMRHLSPEERQRLAQQFRSANDDPQRPFDGYGYQDPHAAAQPGSLGQMFGQARAKDPDLLEQLTGSGSPLNSTMGRLAMAAGAAFLANRLFSQGGAFGGGQPGAGGLGGLGSLLGGGGGGFGSRGGGLGMSDDDFKGRI